MTIKVFIEQLSIFVKSGTVYKGVLLDRPPLSVATPPIFTVTPAYTKEARFSSALNYLGMFVITLQYRQRLKLAPVS
jgi:hypothetical protein